MDVRIPTGGTIGFGGPALLHNAGFGDGDFMKAYLYDGGGGVLDFAVDRSNIVQLLIADLNLALDTWHSIRAMAGGIGSVGWWVNNVFVGWVQLSGQGVTAPYTRWGLHGANGVDFRFIKLYSMALP